MKMVFWHKPICENDTLKLTLFLLGNGCSPNLISKWILLSQCWAPHKAGKRARQLDFVFNNADPKRSTWFYQVIDYNKLLYLNGLPKRWSEPAIYSMKENPPKSQKSDETTTKPSPQKEKRAPLGATKCIKVYNQCHIINLRFPESAILKNEARTLLKNKQ